MIDLVKSAHEVLDVEIAAVTMEEAVALCASMAESGRPHCIATANAEMLMIARKDGELKHILSAAILWCPTEPAFSGQENSCIRRFPNG